MTSTNPRSSTTVDGAALLDGEVGAWSTGVGEGCGGYDTGMADVPDDEQSEAVDRDNLSDQYPPDKPLASEDYGTTGAEQRFHEPLEERVRREQPEREAHDRRSDDTRIVQPVDPDVPGEEGEPIAETVDDPDVRDRAPGDEITGDETTRDVATERVAPPAEETALHVEEER